MKTHVMAALSPPLALSALPLPRRRNLSIMAPAAPGGGWDQTARSMQQALTGGRASVANVQVTNVPGAGGTIGLAQFVNRQQRQSEEPDRRRLRHGRRDHRQPVAGHRSPT